MLKNRAKKRKKWIIPVVVAGVLTITALLTMGGKEEAPQLDLLDTTVLAYRDMEDSISVTGVVESAHSMTVYSTMAYPVMAVHVEVGDYVEAGQLLAELDGKTLQNQITSQQIGLETAERTSGIQVENAQNSYENFKSGLDQGLNATLNGARAQVETTYDNYIRAKNTYERYAKSLNVGENTTIIAAESALRNAENAYDAAYSAYETALESYQDALDAWEQAGAALAEAKSETERLTAAKQEAETQRLALQEQMSNLTEETDPDFSISVELTNQIHALEEQIASYEAEIFGLNMSIDGLFGSGGLQSAYDAAETVYRQTDSAIENAAKALKTRRLPANPSRQRTMQR